MFADLHMQVLAVKPFSKNTFIRVVFVHLVSWNLTINSGTQFVVTVCMHRDFCTRAIRSVAESCLQMTGVCQFAVKPFSKNVFHRVVTWAQGVFEPDNRCGWQTFCRHTDTCLWIQVIRPVDNPWLLICICKLGNASPSKRYFHSSCLLSTVCWTW